MYRKVYAQLGVVGVTNLTCDQLLNLFWFVRCSSSCRFTRHFNIFVPAFIHYVLYISFSEEFHNCRFNCLSLMLMVQVSLWYMIIGANEYFMNCAMVAVTMYLRPNIDDSSDVINIFFRGSSSLQQLL